MNFDKAIEALRNGGIVAFTYESIRNNDELYVYLMDFHGENLDWYKDVKTQQLYVYFR